MSYKFLTLHEFSVAQETCPGKRNTVREGRHADACRLDPQAKKQKKKRKREAKTIRCHRFALPSITPLVGQYIGATQTEPPAASCARSELFSAFFSRQRPAPDARTARRYRSDRCRGDAAEAVHGHGQVTLEITAKKPRSPTHSRE